MIGIDAYPSATLLERAMVVLAGAPREPGFLAAEIMGLRNAPDSVAARLVGALLGADPRVGQLADGRWALVPGAQGSPLLEECAFAVVDVETTGMRPSGSRVLEVGVVVVQGARRERLIDQLLNPGGPVPPWITRLTRIRTADVAHAPGFAEVADDLLSALSGRVFVAHNARFDWSFLSAEFRRVRGLALTGTRLCTARLARRLVPEAESCGLDWLSNYFGLDNPARHRAVGDAWATADLLVRLIERARQEGARTLQDLEALQHRGRRRRSGKGVK